MAENSVQSVDRAMTLVDHLLMGPRNLKSLSALLGIGSPGALKLLRTLAAHGLVERTPNGDYVPGIGCCNLARGYLRQHPITAIARPIMTDLSLQLNGRTVLAVLRGLGQVNLLMLDAHLNNPEDEMPLRVGAAWPLATGQVLLAYSTDAFLEEHLRSYPFHPIAPEIESVDVLRQKLETVRDSGVAVVNPPDRDFSYIAAPIRAVTGQIVAGLGGFAQRHLPLDPQLQSLRAAAMSISEQMGEFRPHSQEGDKAK